MATLSPLDDKPTMSELIEYVDVSTKWHTVGIHLKLHPNKLGAIDDDYRCTDDKVKAMYRLWLSTCCTATRRQLIAVLKMASVALNALANNYEKMSTTVALQSFHETPPLLPFTRDIDVDKLKLIIDKVLVEYHGTLTELGKRSLPTLADKLYSSQLICKDVKDEPTMNDIVEEFKTIINISTNLSEIQDYLGQFLKAFESIGGSYNKIADVLYMTLLETVKKELNYDLIIKK